jgi:membrane protease YdiL (CAAX protease family)
MNALFVEAATSAVFNLVLLVGTPFLLFALVLRSRGVGLGEAVRRAGLQPMEKRYWWISLAIAALAVVLLALFPPSLELALDEGSPQRRFEGLGLGGASLGLAFVYAAITTGFCEEFLFRGLLTGVLSRQMPLWPANLVQTALFTAPHLLLLQPDAGTLLTIGPIVVFSLLVGWLRIMSGSILGPWLIHAAGNFTAALTVAIRTGGS